MNSLGGFNSQEIRRLHPYLSALLRRVKDIERGKIEIIFGEGGSGGGGTIVWGTDDDVQPTGDRNSAGTTNRVARADHQHLFKFPTTVPSSTPDGTAYFDTSASAIKVYVGNTPTTKVVAGGTTTDVQPTGTKSTGTAPRYAFSDHSHPTALLPQDNPQPPVVDEIRYDINNKIVRWNGSAWVPLSVEIFTPDWAENDDVQPTRLKSAGSSTRFARADHSHPTAILPQSNSQTPVVDEIRYTGTNQLVRWNGSAWVNFAGALPVPADPLILPFTADVSSPQNRQLVNHSTWDGIGNATIFYYDINNSQYRLVFARPLVVARSTTPSGRDVWGSKTNELVLKFQTGDPNGATGVLWSRGGGTNVWSPVATQLLDSDVNIIPTDVGVLARSPLTGTSGSRRWFLRGAQEDGSFRAPFAGFATFTASTTPAHGDLSTTLSDGYAYFIHDWDRVDIVKPITDGNKYPTILTHHIVAPPCRVFSTATDPSGHYVADVIWNNIWVIGFFTTTSATSDLLATLPTMAIPFGIRGGRVLLYLHNPQSSAITTVFAVAVRIPTSTGTTVATTSNTSVNIPANTTTVVDLGYLTFDPSTTLSHHRSHPVAIAVVRRKGSESANSNTVYCLAVAIVPQRAS
jgi:hypothetical protein